MSGWAPAVPRWVPCSKGPVAVGPPAPDGTAPRNGDEVLGLCREGSWVQIQTRWGRLGNGGGPVEVNKHAHGFSVELSWCCWTERGTWFMMLSPSPGTENRGWFPVLWGLEGIGRVCPGSLVTLSVSRCKSTIIFCLTHPLFCVKISGEDISKF